MGEEQNPSGRFFGLSRATDVGPLVSHHNTEPTKCDIELAFGGHTKGGVFRSIRDAWMAEINKFREDLDNTDLEYGNVFITGSVVEGNFGCRGLSSAESELKTVSRYWDRYDPAARDVVRDITREDTIMGMWTKANDLLGDLDNSDVLIDDTLVALISDIDIFVTVSDQDEAIEMETERDSKLRDAMEYFKRRMRNKKKGRMPYLINFVQQDNPRINGGVLKTEADFNEIIDRYY